MIYVTGDTHGEFYRFARRRRQKLPFELTENDYVIICGDFGLLWGDDNKIDYDIKWLINLPFTILWIQGNHENYDKIETYPIETWNGGKVRHIVRDKIILLERGQVFTIENKKIFTFGGASSHDIKDGILDPASPTYKADYKRKQKCGQLFRVLNVSWWKQELPTKEELEEGSKNLEKVEYHVDYVITHCASSIMQSAIVQRLTRKVIPDLEYRNDILTDYLEELELKLQYKHWYCGHYHEELYLDEKHTVLYENIVPLEVAIGG